ncbi:MAG: hypothetical protein AAF479_07700 [Pseudomonadota bacterium]
MTLARESEILREISDCTCPEFFAGYVSGLRHQKELTGGVPVAIVKKLKANGWKNYEPFPELNPPAGA